MDKIRIADTEAYVMLTDREFGDARKANNWVFVNQKHSGNVLLVNNFSLYRSLPENIYTFDNYDPLTTAADAIVGKDITKPIGVFGADCALLGLASNEGVVAVIHAGWRGLLTNIIRTSVSAMHLLSATDIWAVMGPCIHSECYEFSADLIERISLQIGCDVGTLTNDAKSALDLPLAVTELLKAEDVIITPEIASCTACDDRWFSHRKRGEISRHGLGVMVNKTV